MDLKTLAARHAPDMSDTTRRSGDTLPDEICAIRARDAMERYTSTSTEDFTAGMLVKNKRNIGNANDWGVGAVIQVDKGRPCGGREAPLIDARGGTDSLEEIQVLWLTPGGDWCPYWTSARFLEPYTGPVD